MIDSSPSRTTDEVLERLRRAERMPNGIFTTPRLSVRAAIDADAAFVISLWSDPRVMRYVGFPSGIPTADVDVPERIRRGEGGARLLIAEDRSTHAPVGQCMLGALDASGVCEPDIKLAPDMWRRGYGRELWSAMIDRLFESSACGMVRGSPNVANVASIRMQESAGMKRVGQGLSEFPPSMRAFTEAVPHYVYEISRGEWERRGRAHRTPSAMPEPGL
jgi:RimJ/RimL family protein N-acetyltransferase